MRLKLSGDLLQDEEGMTLITNMLSRDIYRVTLFLLTAYVTAFGDCVS
jgi:hypothetical protein